MIVDDISSHFQRSEEISLLQTLERKVENSTSLSESYYVKVYSLWNFWTSQGKDLNLTYYQKKKKITISRAKGKKPLSYENSSKACIICSLSTQGYIALFVTDSADKENTTQCFLRRQLVPR